MFDAVITFVSETEGPEQHVITHVFRVEFDSADAFANAMRVMEDLPGVLNVEVLSAQ
jgi:hypothetical protein